MKDFDDEPPPAVIDESKRLVDAALGEPGSIASKRLLAQVFERELDELHTPEGSSYFSEKREDREAEDLKRRDERYLMAAVAAETRRALEPWGIKVETGYSETLGVVRDGEYVLRAKDREGRAFDVKYGLELAEQLVAEGGHRSLVERMGQAVARSVIEERKKYFERMA